MRASSNYFEKPRAPSRADDGKVLPSSDKVPKPAPSQGVPERFIDLPRSDPIPIPQPVLHRQSAHRQPIKESKKKGRGKKRNSKIVRLHMKHVSARPLSDNFLRCWLDKHRSIEPSLEATELAMTFVDVDTIYEFRLSRYFAKTTSAGGVLDDYFDNNPASYAEWSALTTLFSMVRIRKVVARFSTTYSRAVPTTVSVGQFRPMVININFDDIGAPGGYAGALDSPLNKIWNYAFDTSPIGPSLALNFTGEHEPLWADVTSPSSSTLYQGCPGCCQMYVDTASVSTEIIGVVQDLYIQMMNRY